MNDSAEIEKFSFSQDQVNIESTYDHGTILSDNKDTYQSELDGSSKNACL